ncbi:hypothetical protein [Halorarius litoreus]|uniref:hypothetical protein n=1 Tax=Halorarius litoreus TaxID=2962676 RepID=UPI0020CF0B3A|nr:hypothetical protein [Halorarius litoreus]
MATPPRVCPDCGARNSYEPRYTTGGGWRRIYRCRECGRQATTAGPTRRVAPFAVLGGAVGAAWLYLRKRLD